MKTSCNRCGWSWYRRRPRKPSACPNCQSRQFDRPYTLKAPPECVHCVQPLAAHRFEVGQVAWCEGSQTHFARSAEELKVESEGAK